MYIYIDICILVRAWQNPAKLLAQAPVCKKASNKARGHQLKTKAWFSLISICRNLMLLVAPRIRWDLVERVEFSISRPLPVTWTEGVWRGRGLLGDTTSGRCTTGAGAETTERPWDGCWAMKRVTPRPSGIHREIKLILLLFFFFCLTITCNKKQNIFSCCFMLVTDKCTTQSQFPATVCACTHNYPSLTARKGNALDWMQSSWLPNNTRQSKWYLHGHSTLNIHNQQLLFLKMSKPFSKDFLFIHVLAVYMFFSSF